MPASPVSSQSGAPHVGSTKYKEPNRSKCVIQLGLSLTIIPIVAAIIEIIRIGQVLTGYAFWSKGKISKLNRCKNFGIYLACLISTPLMPIVLALISLYGIIVGPTQVDNANDKIWSFFTQSTWILG